ncbi:putative glycolipid-binding domain-containing protein [Frankia sp. AiPs1]|uniref:putative glycolipid-binding domain-containing protein n=1 Tax=Frankia sp. AiPs1 TaxID=573493 RepID=UPI0020448D36|nr:putative glycolipid-binding domain-containing protein [Frankia sp. AiPs1]MCM3923298.1 putative glycolipid-binding domain-containing protein [Frankia sp. AiPs1]
MAFTDLPATAAWRHQRARCGFEVVYFERSADGYRVEGGTTALEEGLTWLVTYRVSLDGAGRTRAATVHGRSASGSRSVTLEADGGGRWRVDGVVAAELAGCLDVDLESSAVTNALPVRRLDLAVGRRADAPAAYVRAVDLSVHRLEQTYTRVADDGSCQRYDYTAPAFAFACQLTYDDAALVVDYPGIALRAF